jgi:hypothetical protein
MGMKKIFALVLALMMVLTSGAFAFDPARFAGVEDVKVDFDAANPTAYSVTAGFTGGAMAGGQVLVRYKNMGAAEEIPMMLVAFTTDGVKAANMAVRTDANKYNVVCTDLTKAGMTVFDTEGSVLVTGASVDMLKDMVASEYTEIKLWNDDSAKAFSFMLNDADREMIKLFIEEYEAEVVPMIVAGGSVEKVFNVLAAEVTVETAEDISAAIAEIQAKPYAVIQNGMNGENVQAMQQQLIDLGYLNGKADGIFGKNTAKAVCAFQMACGLEVTGVADEETQRQMEIAMLVKE